MMFAVDTDHLEQVTAAFTKASSEVGSLRVKLVTQAAGPGDEPVIGSAAAAATYGRALQTWTGNLDELAAALATMARKVSAVAEHYQTTEAGNTVRATR